MKITANRLTLLRILLLPLPCLLLYGGPEAKITALGVGSLLGLTDYFDGRLARRHGITRLGTLLDPVADKIFVTVFYLILSRLGYLSLFLVGLILVREFLVTVLRQIIPGQLPVTWLAKTKTALQMMGAALIVLVSTFPEARALILVATAFLFLLGLRFSSLPGRFKAILATGGLFFPALALLPAAWLPEILGGLVLLITWFSATSYFQRAWHTLSAKDLFLLARQLLLPLSALILIPKGAFWPLALFLLISELTRQALGLLAGQTAPPRYWGLLGALGLVLAGLEVPAQMVTAFWACGLVASLCEVIKTFFEERNSLLS